MCTCVRVVVPLDSSYGCMNVGDGVELAQGIAWRFLDSDQIEEYMESLTVRFRGRVILDWRSGDLRRLMHTRNGRIQRDCTCVDHEARVRNLHEAHENEEPDEVDMHRLDFWPTQALPLSFGDNDDDASTSQKFDASSPLEITCEPSCRAAWLYVVYVQLPDSLVWFTRGDACLSIAAWRALAEQRAEMADDGARACRVAQRVAAYWSSPTSSSLFSSLLDGCAGNATCSTRVSTRVHGARSATPSVNELPFQLALLVARMYLQTEHVREQVDAREPVPAYAWCACCGASVGQRFARLLPLTHARQLVLCVACEPYTCALFA